jgi:hypothetical protein
MAYIRPSNCYYSLSQWKIFTFTNKIVQNMAPNSSLFSLCHLLCTLLTGYLLPLVTWFHCWSVWRQQVLNNRKSETVQCICNASYVHSPSSFEIRVSLFSCTTELHSCDKVKELYRANQNMTCTILYCIIYISFFTFHLSCSCVNRNIFVDCQGEKKISFFSLALSQLHHWHVHTLSFYLITYVAYFYNQHVVVPMQ